MSPRQVHISLTTQREGSGGRGKCTEDHDTGGELRGLREAHTSLHDTEGMVWETRKDPHKSLPSKLLPAEKARSVNRSTGNDSRDK